MFVQAVGNRFRGISLQYQMEHILHHACRKLINNEMVLILRVFQVAKHSEGCDKLPFPALNVLMAPYLDGNIPAVGIIHQIFYRHYQIVRCGSRLCAVIIIIDRNEPHTHERKDFFDIFSRFDKVSAKP